MQTLQSPSISSQNNDACWKSSPSSAGDCSLGYSSSVSQSSSSIRSPAAVSPPYASKRERVQAELLSSEASYVRSLQLLCDCYLSPLFLDVPVSLQSSAFSTLAQLAPRIFGNIRELCAFHRRLCARMEQVAGASFSTTVASSRTDIVSSTEHAQSKSDLEGKRTPTLVCVLKESLLEMEPLYLEYVKGFSSSAAALESAYLIPEFQVIDPSCACEVACGCMHYY